LCCDLCGYSDTPCLSFDLKAAAHVAALSQSWRLHYSTVASR